jgi:hypothetical protein
MRAIGRIRATSTLLAAVFLLVGCASKTVTVEIPPRIDLTQHGAVGLVDLDSSGAGSLSQSMTGELLQAIQWAQPGTPVLELGSRQEVLGTIGRDRLDRAALRAVREEYGVDVVLVGQVDVAEIRPRLKLGESLNSLHARAELQATLGARLLHTASGATVWTRQATGKADVASVGIGGSGRPSIRAKDPDAARDRLVRSLVRDITADFRPTYERRRAP